MDDFEKRSWELKASKEPKRKDLENGAVEKEKQAEAAVDEEEQEEEADARGSWGNKFEFILTCVGYAVGLGNVWRFPYKCYVNGGGAFLIPYLIMLLVVGVPMFYLELSIGQFSSRGPITVWKLSPIFWGIGYGAMTVCFLIGLYYNVIVAYTLFYFFASMRYEVPWTRCYPDESWVTSTCQEPLKTAAATAAPSNISFTTAATPAFANSSFGNAVMTTAATVVNQTTAPANATIAYTTPSEDYFKHYVLSLTDNINDFGILKWDMALCLTLAWLVVLLVLIKGIKSLGKIVYFSALFPYVMLTILMVRGATLEGAADGIKYYLKPEWSRLGDANVWSDAATQIFYSLGVAQASLIALASFNKFHNNCFQDALMIPVINCGTSIFAGCVVFSVLGHMAWRKQTDDFSTVADQGPGLVFVAYPEALAQMDISPLWSLLFFFMIANLGFSSQFSVAETVMIAIQDKFPKQLRTGKIRPILFRTAFCTACLLLGLVMCTQGGFYVVMLMDNTVGGYPLLILGFLEVTTLAWVYGFRRLEQDITMMLGFSNWGQLFWRACWQFLTPLTLLGITVAKAYQHEPFYVQIKERKVVYTEWGQILGYVFIALPLAPLPICFMWNWCKSGALGALKRASKPGGGWGPAKKEDRECRYADDQSYGDRESVEEGWDSNGAVVSQIRLQSQFPNHTQLDQGHNNVAFVRSTEM